MSLEQLDAQSDSISSSTMSTAPKMTGTCSSQLSVGSTSSGASKQAIPVDVAANKTENPVQPAIEFPVTMFGKVGRSFQERWYQQYPWLEYSKELDAAFCFPCRFFHPRPLRSDKAFTLTGFKDWKHALGKKGILTAHSAGKAHTEAMMSWKEYQVRAKAGSSIGVQLDQMGTQVISQNRAYVAALMEAVLFSSQQGIAFRGHDESDDSLNPGNFKALMHFLSRHCQAISVRFQEHSKSAVWLSPSFQNEIIHFLSVEVRSMIKHELHEAKYYTLMADESKDISKREQLSIAFRYIYKFRTVERFVGFILASELNAQALAEYIFQKVSDLKLDLGNLVSQCYDGASVMSGCNTGVQTIIKKKCPQAVYIHCSAHRLNLVLVDVSKKVKAASDFFAHLQSIYVFFSSSKCHELFFSIQKSKGGREMRLKKLSDTRWSCRYDSVVAVMTTYSALLETLEQTAEVLTE